MIRITAELVSAIHKSRDRNLGRIEIHNDNTGDRRTGNYKFKIFKWNNSDKVWKEGSITGFDRVRLGVWDLLCLCLLSVLHKRIIKLIK